MDTQIRTIGRAPSPAERGVRLLLEDLEFRDVIARNLFSSNIGYPLRDAWSTWDSMTDAERERWREKAIEDFRSDLDREEIPEPDGPDPDGRHPVPIDEYRRTA